MFSRISLLLALALAAAAESGSSTDSVNLIQTKTLVADEAPSPPDVWKMPHDEAPPEAPGASDGASPFDVQNPAVEKLPTHPVGEHPVQDVWKLPHDEAPTEAPAAPDGGPYPDESAHADKGVNLSAVFAEYIAMTLFVMIGCGSAMGVAKEPGWVLQVSLAFGLGITALAYTIGHISGAHINCAVTLGLVITGNCSVLQGTLNLAAQILGSITGALILTLMWPEETDKTKGLGANGVQEGMTKTNAFVGEVMMTFLLMFVVLETAVNPAFKANREMAALAIGFAVFLAHSVLIPIDGCSINPTRSFGPALVRKLCYKNPGSFDDMWVFCVGPLVGASAAALVQHSGLLAH